jgi:hypothetical protein
MALSETTRAEMYNYFSATPLGKEVTSEMIANFPDLKFDDLVTKDFLRAELEAQSGTLSRESAELGMSLRKESAELGMSLRKESAELGMSLRKEIADTRFELSKDTHDTVQRAMLWTIATMIALAGVLSGLGFAFH